MSSHGVKHDYHIINPSPWPLVGSVAALLWALGLVTGLRGLFGIPKGNWVMFFIGVALILFTMFAWWRDVIKESKAGDHTPVVQIGLRYGMIMFICSEVMFFAAFFWMFFEMALFHGHRAGAAEAIDDVRTAWSTWPPKGVETLDPWQLPLVNTLLLLTSGTTVTWAHHALAQGDRKGAKLGLLLTVLLGIAFTCVQAKEYLEIINDHNFHFFLLPDSAEQNGTANLFGSTFFMATGFHGFHVLIGTIFLIVCLLRLVYGDFTPKKHFGFEAAAWYWHFVDVVWLFLFAFVYVIFWRHALTVSPKGGGINFLAAAAGRCPVCAKGKLFRSFLKVADSCALCGTSFKAADTGDGPVVFVLLITGFATCFSMLYAFLAFQWPAWMHLVVWPVFACVLSLGLMQPLKGLMVAAQLKNRVRD